MRVKLLSCAREWKRLRQGGLGMPGGGTHPLPLPEHSEPKR